MSDHIPHNIELEKTVLGCILLEDKAIHRVIGIIRHKEFFYVQQHQIIWEVMLRMYEKGRSIDILTVFPELRSQDFDENGPMFYLTDLYTRVSSTGRLEEWCMVLQDLHIRRMLIGQAHVMIKKGYTESLESSEVLAVLQRSLDDVQKQIFTSDEKTFAEVLEEAMVDVERLSNRKAGEVTGVDTGFQQLNELTNGYQKGELIILAARPGMGKTAFAVKQIMDCASSGKAVAVFELEMRQVDMAKRLICQYDPFFHANMLFKHGIKKDDHWIRLQEVQSAIQNLPVMIETTPAMNIFDCMVKATKMKQQHKNLGLIVVDYLQLMRGYPGKRYSNREQEVSDVSRFLKKMALDLDVPVMALSQLSREVEKRGDKRPILSDLRESGSLEQDADMVMFLYRPEYYDIETIDDGTPSDGVAEVIIAKHRTGGLNTVLVGFNDNRIRFDELVNVRKQKENEYAVDQPF